MDIPASECKRLYRLDPRLRFGVTYLDGYGKVATVFALMERHEVGSDDPSKRTKMYFMPHDIPGLLYMYDRKGRMNPSSSDWDGMIPVLLDYPGQDFGNKAVLNGDYVSFLTYHAPDKATVQRQRREAVRSQGKSMDDFIRDAARDVVDYHKFIVRNDTGASDPIRTQEDITKGMKSRDGQHYELYRQNDYSVSFEHAALRDAGLEK